MRNSAEAMEIRVELIEKEGGAEIRVRQGTPADIPLALRMQVYGAVMSTLLADARSRCASEGMSEADMMRAIRVSEPQLVKEMHLHKPGGGS